MFKYLMFFLACSSCACADFYFVESKPTYSFLLYNGKTHKYAYYLTDYDQFQHPLDTNNITSNFTPQSLKSAQKVFPYYNLTKKNYISN